MKEVSGDYLRAVVDHGNISNAARALFISQPYLSKYIRNLEDELGTDLIDRNTTPLTLTYAGERYLSYVDEMKLIYTKMKNEMAAITNLKKGRLRLGINAVLGSHTLFSLLPQYIEAYPGIEIELIEKNANEMESQLLQQNIDICVNLLPIFNEQIMYETLYEEPLLLVVPAGHPLYDSELNDVIHIPFSPSNLNGEEFVLLKPDLGLRRTTDTIFKDYGIVPNIVIETENIDSAFRLSERGIGLTIIPECVIKRDQLITNCNLYTFGNPIYKNNVVISYKRGVELSSPAIAFLNMAKEVLERH